ncbi:DUF3077 domain-containing protein [Pseudomonas sp. Pseusp122]|uniref:DUF6124 family protein n=1 Tax=unclassified Pseudomonas TaxID=196821 RepID=UPI0039A4FF5C
MTKPIPFFIVNESLTKEQSLIHACDLLRYMKAIGNEFGEGLTGEDRDKAFALVHLAESTYSLVERSL